MEVFTSILVVSDEEQEMDIMASDSCCINNLLLVRDIQLKKMKMNPRDPASHSFIGKVGVTVPAPAPS